MLLTPLKARALDAKSSKPILGDAHAKEIIDKFDYNFDKVAFAQSEISAVAVRMRFFDSLKALFLSRNPSATIYT